MKFGNKPPILRLITNSAGFPYGIMKTKTSSRWSMKEALIHQWKDWLLRYVGDDTYELIGKENFTVRKIKVKNDIDAENQSHLIIKMQQKNNPNPLASITFSTLSLTQG